ncbi:uncharacterized protein [Rutidosis leptorrhynchoides]|uniref:uncharacterized protein n=1 Tax=Rutidosis leptorrhynchoides TaxID=125765 RepID=UPI003A999BC0
MKRKRGRKGKSKNAPKVGATEAEPSTDNLSVEDVSVPDGDEKDDSISKMETETVSNVAEQPEKPPVVGAPAVVDKPVGRLVYNRVKLKIKPSKPLEPEPQATTSTDLHAHNDTNKSSQQDIGLIDKQVVSEKIEEKANSVPEINVGVSTTQPKKTGSIIIKSSKSYTSSSSPCSSNPAAPQAEKIHQKEPESIIIKSSKSFSSSLSPCRSNPAAPQAGKNHQNEPESIVIKSLKSFSSSLSPCSSNPAVAQATTIRQKEPESVSRESVYNKQELIASLEVIKKIMKMDASEPFNVPVDPVALGIPDYFDVIKTPMDFGTICSNLESGIKYKNSEDVYKDVQYIWENCYKYNNKGDYVLELMKRVKKNFMKYWTAAGLYSDQQQDGNVSSHGKSTSKSGNLKIKSRKRHGFKRHKDDCMCAICIMVRRRQEREKIMNPVDDQTDNSDSIVQQVKLEGTSTAGSQNGDDTSSSSDNSQNKDADDADMEEKGEEVKLDNKELQSKSSSQSKQHEEKEKLLEMSKENTVAEQSQVDDKSVTEKLEDIQMAEAADATKDNVPNDVETIQHENETAGVEIRKPTELLDAGAKAKLYKTLHQRYDNPMVMELCASLFPQKSEKSIWSRPHSLVPQHGSSSRKSSISAVIASFIKR